MAECNHNYIAYGESTCNGGLTFRNNSTNAAKIQPSSYTCLQTADLNFYYLQITTHSFQLFHVQWIMWIILENPSNESRGTVKKVPVLQVKCHSSLTVCHQRISVVKNESAVRELQFKKNYLDGNRNTPDKGLWSCLLTDRQISNLCAVPHMYLNPELQNNKSFSIYRAGYNWTDTFNIFSTSVINFLRRIN